MLRIDFYKLFANTEEELAQFSNIILHINSDDDSFLSDFVKYTAEWKKGFPDLHYTLTDSYKDDNFSFFLYRAEGGHTGIFRNSLPTNKHISFKGMVSLHLKDNSLHIDLIEDVHFVQTIINTFSEKIYTEKDFVNNDFAGPAGNIYRSILGSRNPPCSIDQLLVNTFRWMMNQTNEKYLPVTPFLEKMQKEVDVDDLMIPIKGENIQVRWYKPKTCDYSQAPTVVYFHGGGWVMASVKHYDLVTKKLAWEGQLNIFSIDYRLAPEFTFPTYYMDCYLGYEWVVKNLKKLGIKNTHIAVAGDSAGGTIAGGLVHHLNKNNTSLPDAVMMLSPATDLIFENYPSFLKKARNNLFLSQGLACFQRALCIPVDEWQNPVYSPMYGDLDYFPPTLILSGTDDPLFDDNLAFYKKLTNAGVKDVRHVIGEQMPHDYQIFIGMTEEEAIASKAMVEFLHKNLGEPSN